MCGFMNLFTDLIFSSIGLGYFIYGKKTAELNFLIFGIILMGYSYLISGLLLDISIGIVLMICPFITRKIL